MFLSSLQNIKKTLIFSIKMQPTFLSPSYQYGFHVTKHPTMVKTINEIIKNTPLTAIQLYVSNSRSKIMPKFDHDDLFAARKIIKNNNLYVVIHGSLLYNLAGTTTG